MGGKTDSCGNTFAKAFMGLFENVRQQFNKAVNTRKAFLCIGSIKMCVSLNTFSRFLQKKSTHTNLLEKNRVTQGAQNSVSLCLFLI